MATVAADDSGFAGVSSQQARVRVAHAQQGGKANDGEQEAAVPKEPVRIRWSHQEQQSRKEHHRRKPRKHELRAENGVFEQDREAAQAVDAPEADTTDVNGEPGCRRGALGKPPALAAAAAATTVLGGAALRARRGSRRMDVHGVAKQIGKISKSVGKSSKQVSKDIHRLGDDVERVGKALS